LSGAYRISAPPCHGPARLPLRSPRSTRQTRLTSPQHVARDQTANGPQPTQFAKGPKLALITNAPDLTPTEAVTRYKGLADIERGFRVLKSDIEIAPVHHRLPDRIRAHAMICFLALVLYRVMRMRLKAKGQSASPRTALSLLARIQKHTAHAGKRSFEGLSKTTPEQLDLFDALNLPKPT